MADKVKLTRAQHEALAALDTFRDGYWLPTTLLNGDGISTPTLRSLVEHGFVDAAKARDGKFWCITPAGREALGLSLIGGEMKSRNFCDMSPAERVQALGTIQSRLERNKSLLAEAYGGDYCQDEGGTPYIRRRDGSNNTWRWSPELVKAADSWFAGHRSYWVRSGGAEMLCRMEHFPEFIVEEYLNGDTYGRFGIGAIVRPEHVNEFEPRSRTHDR